MSAIQQGKLSDGTFSTTTSDLSKLPTSFSVQNDNSEKYILPLSEPMLNRQAAYGDILYSNSTKYSDHQQNDTANKVLQHNSESNPSSFLLTTTSNIPTSNTPNTSSLQASTLAETKSINAHDKTTGTLFSNPQHSLQNSIAHNAIITASSVSHQDQVSALVPSTPIQQERATVEFFYQQTPKLLKPSKIELYRLKGNFPLSVTLSVAGSSRNSPLPLSSSSSIRNTSKRKTPPLGSSSGKTVNVNQSQNGLIQQNDQPIIPQLSADNDHNDSNNNNNNNNNVVFDAALTTPLHVNKRQKCDDGDNVALTTTIENNTTSCTAAVMSDYDNHNVQLSSLDPSLLSFDPHHHNQQNNSVVLGCNIDTDDDDDGDGEMSNYPKCDSTDITDTFDHNNTTLNDGDAKSSGSSNYSENPFIQTDNQLFDDSSSTHSFYHSEGYSPAKATNSHHHHQGKGKFSSFAWNASSGGKGIPANIRPVFNRFEQEHNLPPLAQKLDDIDLVYSFTAYSNPTKNMCNRCKMMLDGGADDLIAHYNSHVLFDQSLYVLAGDIYQITDSKLPPDVTDTYDVEVRVGANNTNDDNDGNITQHDDAVDNNTQQQGNNQSITKQNILYIADLLQLSQDSCFECQLVLSPTAFKYTTPLGQRMAMNIVDRVNHDHAIVLQHAKDVHLFQELDDLHNRNRRYLRAFIADKRPHEIRRIRILEAEEEVECLRDLLYDICPTLEYGYTIPEDDDLDQTVRLITNPRENTPNLLAADGNDKNFTFPQSTFLHRLQKGPVRPMVPPPTKPANYRTERLTRKLNEKFTSNIGVLSPALSRNVSVSTQGSSFYQNTTPHVVPVRPPPGLFGSTIFSTNTPMLSQSSSNTSNYNNNNNNTNNNALGQHSNYSNKANSTKSHQPNIPTSAQQRQQLETLSKGYNHEVLKIPTSTGTSLYSVAIKQQAQPHQQPSRFHQFPLQYQPNYEFKQ